MVANMDVHIPPFFLAMLGDPLFRGINHTPIHPTRRFVGKYFVVRFSTTKTTKILPLENYPLYGIILFNLSVDTDDPRKEQREKGIKHITYPTCIIILLYMYLTHNY